MAEQEHVQEPEPLISGPLQEAKLAIMRECPYLQKSKGKGLNYSFANESDLIEQLHPLFCRHGLTITPWNMMIMSRDQFTTSKGSNMACTVVKVRYRLSHAPSGQWEWVTALGEGADVSDKSTSKAMTSAKKNALLHTFLIQTGDDPDQFQRTQRAGQANGQSQPQKTKKGPPRSGAELYDRLVNFEQSLVKKGLCKDTELIAHMQRKGKEKGYPQRTSEWSGEQIDFAVAEVKRFEQSKRNPQAAATPAEPLKRDKPRREQARERIYNTKTLDDLNRLIKTMDADPNLSKSDKEWLADHAELRDKQLRRAATQEFEKVIQTPNDVPDNYQSEDSSEYVDVF